MSVLNQSDSSNTFRALGQTSGMGFVLAASMAGGYYGGHYLDLKFGTDPWLMIASLLICMAGGILEVCNMVKRAVKETEKEG